MRGLRVAVLLALAAAILAAYSLRTRVTVGAQSAGTRIDAAVVKNTAHMLDQGRHTFRFDTFGDRDFWGGTLQLHKALEGSQFGGVGPGVSPATALAVGLKVDVDALPPSLIAALKTAGVERQRGEAAGCPGKVCGKPSQLPAVVKPMEQKRKVFRLGPASV